MTKIDRPFTGVLAVARAQVAFEIARRRRFARELVALPEGVTAHILLTGGVEPGEEAPISESDGRLGAYRDVSAIGRRISRAYLASRHHLRTHLEGA